MSTPQNLVDLLRQRADEAPDRELYTFLADGETPQGRLTRSELAAAARAIAGRLQRAGAVGERALLLHPPGLELIAAFFGCLHAGAVSVPAFQPRGRRNLPRLRSIAEDARPRWVLTTESWRERAERWAQSVPELEGAEVIASDRATADDAASWRAPALDGSSLAFLQYTSGSTATPKGVMVSHGNLLHNEAAIARAFRQQEGGVSGRTVVGWLPLHHDMGLIGNVLQPLYSGGQAILMSPPAFLQRPVRWLQAISRYRAHTSGGPNFAYELCVDKVSEAERAELDLSCWQVAFNGAEPVRASTLERFATAFAPAGFRRGAFIPCYGLAEATLLVSAGGDGAGRVRRLSAARLEDGAVADAEADEAARSLVSCGVVAKGLEVRVVDPATGLPSAADRVGEIWVGGDGVTPDGGARGSVAQGYWHRREATAETFAGKLASGEGPFLRTGDLGFLTAASGAPEVFVTGRLKDLIILRGRNHYPQDIELTAEGSHPDLEPGGGAAFAVEGEATERLVVVHELKRRPQAEPPAIAAALRRAVMEEHEVAAPEVVLIRVGSLPRTTSGKVRRRACADAYQAGELKVVAASAVVSATSAEPRDGVSTADAIANREALLALPAGKRLAGLMASLCYRAAEAARRDPSDVAGASTGLSLVSLGLDSLAVAELRHGLEEDLGVAPSWERLMSEASLEELAGEILGEIEQGSTADVALDAAEIDDDFIPLSRGQHGLWLQGQLAPESTADNLSFAARLRAVDEVALEQAIGGWVERHPALRTTFPLRDGVPYQQIGEAARLEIERVDAGDKGDAWLREQLAAAVHTPFDLAAGPLVRVSLWRRADGEAVLLLVAHHTVIDLTSLFVLLEELGESYRQGAGVRSSNARSTTPRDIAIQVERQEALLAGDTGEELWRYWQDRLQDFEPILEWPADRPRPGVLRYRGAALPARLPGDLVARLGQLAEGARTTLYTVLLAAFQTLLHRVCGQQDLTVGTPFAGRTHPDLALQVGYFVNLLPLRAEMAGDPTFEAVLTEASAQVVGALEHQDFPAALLVEKLKARRDPSRHPLFQAFFALERAQRQEDAGLAGFVLGQGGAQVRLGELELESIDLPVRVAPFDLTSRWIAADDGLCGQWVYSTDLFDAVTIERLARRYRTLLESLARQPHRRLSELEVLAPVERQQLWREWNATAADPAAEGPCLHHLFFAQVVRTPDAEALLWQGRAWTYGELASRVRRLARRLQNAGVAPEVRVGLAFERGPEMVVALLAVLEAGGAYVPLDPAQPAARLAGMAGDAGISLLLTNVDDALATAIFDGETMRLGEAWDSDDDEPWNARALGVAGSEHMAYVLFTSGTTGRPKGVMIPHRGAVNFLRAMRRQPGLGPDDLLLSETTLSFDISVLEIFLPLMVGARVEIASRAEAADGRLLARRLEASGATLLQATPPTWRMLLDAGWRPPEDFAALCGGEAMAPDLAAQLTADGGRLWNLYGPTETTVWSTAGLVDPRKDGLITVGRPIRKMHFRIYGRRLEPMPLGSHGELLVGGTGTGRGYIGSPIQTADKFIPDPQARQPGKRLYRTGDLARFFPDGRLDILGRIDHQVKVRGFRIELGEIEVALRDLPEIADAAVLAREGVPGHRRLVGYVVPEVSDETEADAASAPTETLRRGLASRLPDYMIPTVFVTLDKLPLSRTGKVDRRALAEIDLASTPAEAGTAPSGPIETLLADLWCELLGLEGVRTEDNFFELGGDSVLSVRMASGAARSGLELTPALLHEHQTLGALARAAAEHLVEKIDRWLDVPRAPLVPLPMDYTAIEHTAVDLATVESESAGSDTVQMRLTVNETATLRQGTEESGRFEAVLAAAALEAFAAWTGARQLWLRLDRVDHDASALLPLDLEVSSTPNAMLAAAEEQIASASDENLGRVGALADTEGAAELARRLEALPQPQVRLVVGEGETSIGDELLAIQARELEGALTVDWLYREAVHRRFTVEGLAEDFLVALRRFADHFGTAGDEELTPEDFPDVDLDQGQLDKILQQLG